MPAKTASGHPLIEGSALSLETNGSPATNGSLPGTIQLATWLSEKVLLLAGAIRSHGHAWTMATVVVGSEVLPADVATYPYDGPAGAHSNTLILLQCRWTRAPHDIPQQLIFSGEREPLVIDAAHLPEKLVELSTLLRETVVGLDREKRARVMEFLLSSLAEPLTDRGNPRLGRALFAAREALRERLPAPVMSPGSPLAGHVDLFLAVGANAFYARGWAVSSDAPVARITAVSPEGCRVELLDRLFPVDRPDLNGVYEAFADDYEAPKAGFLCFFQTPVPSHVGEGWLFEIANAAADEIELAVSTVGRNRITVRDTLLHDIAHDSDPDCKLLAAHLAPALQLIQKRQSERVCIDKVMQYGSPPQTPPVSLIIPLYGRTDFLEHQLSQFVHDRELASADLIYVLDSPDLANAIQAEAPRLERLYRVPFRVATLRTNVGYSGANNAGVSLARGRLLLLLNADVLPDRPGWLSKMMTFHDATPKIGALGPKLLYEDDAIQHAGLFFYQEPETGLWYNEHPYKGLHRTFPAASVTRRVPAVTGACMMLAADLYRALGGLSGLYIQGDFEDSDLCLRLIEAGRENWYLPEIELYHLEGQSYPGTLRRLTSRYNRWLHSRLWSRRIEAVMSHFGNRPASPHAQE